MAKPRKWTFFSLGKNYQNGNSTHYIDGVSFKQVLIGDKDSERDWILGMGGRNQARLTENGVENKFVFRDRVIRNERFKIRIDTKRDASAFYDLQEDPAENINLIDSLNN